MGKNFDMIRHTTDQPISKIDLSTFSDAANDLSADFRSKLLHLAESQLSILQDGYQEFVELCITFLIVQEVS